MKLNTHVLICTLSIAAAFAQVLHAQVPVLCETQKLIADEQDELDIFGHSVSISGDVAIVGAWNDEADGTPGDFAVGAAYIFRRHGRTWTEEQRLTAPDAASEDRFGDRVAISGDVAVVTAPTDDDACPPHNSCESGSVYVFRRIEGNWIMEQKLVPADTEARDFFGSSVAVHEDVVVVGTPGEDDACGGGWSCDAGAAYVFRYDGQGAWLEEQKLLASDGESEDYMGSVVAVGEEGIVVGAQAEDERAVSAGAAYFFAYDPVAGEWREEQKLTASDASIYDFFGYAVDIEGDRIIVGARLDDDACPGDELCYSGSAYVFRKTGNLEEPWVEEGKLLASDGKRGDEFGETVSISGDVAAVGKRWDDSGGEDAGSAYLFRYDALTGKWREERKFVGSDVEAGDRFGESVSLDGDLLIVSAPSDDDAGNASGAAYTFELRSGTSCDAAILDGPHIAVTWNEGFNGQGMLGVMRATSPWEFVGPTQEIDTNASVRFAEGLIYVVNPESSSIQVFDPDGLVPVRTYPLDGACQPRDVAVIDAEVAYVTCSSTAQLLRLDLATGETEAAIDLSLFADADGNPDQNMMAVHEGKLFVQIRRLSGSVLEGSTPPAMLAVVDLETETLLDVDPVTPGTQAIELQGTPPRFKMQIVPETQRLFVSATGGFFDEGGIEMIDLTSLQSMGLVVDELGGEVGADLGACVFVTPDLGYLTFSTDLALSSHLTPFSLSGGVGSGPEHHVTVGYFVPVLLHDPATDTLFYPEGSSEEYGVHVFDAQTGERLTDSPVPTTGPPSDMVLFCVGPECDTLVGPSFLRGDCNDDRIVDISDGVCILNFLFLGGNRPGCVAVTNTNGDEDADISDATYLLNHLFLGGPALVPPFPGCGTSDLPADEVLGCATPSC